MYVQLCVWGSRGRELIPEVESMGLKTANSLDNVFKRKFVRKKKMKRMEYIINICVITKLVDDNRLSLVLINKGLVYIYIFLFLSSSIIF